MPGLTSAALLYREVKTNPLCYSLPPGFTYVASTVPEHSNDIDAGFVLDHLHRRAFRYQKWMRIRRQEMFELEMKLFRRDTGVSDDGGGVPLDEVQPRRNFLVLPRSSESSSALPSRSQSPPSSDYRQELCEEHPRELAATESLSWDALAANEAATGLTSSSLNLSPHQHQFPSHPPTTNSHLEATQWKQGDHHERAPRVDFGHGTELRELRIKSQHQLEREKETLGCLMAQGRAEMFFTFIERKFRHSDPLSDAIDERRFKRRKKRSGPSLRITNNQHKRNRTGDYDGGDDSSELEPTPAEKDASEVRCAIRAAARNTTRETLLTTHVLNWMDPELRQYVRHPCIRMLPDFKCDKPCGKCPLVNYPVFTCVEFVTRGYCGDDKCPLEHPTPEPPECAPLSSSTRHW